MYLKRLTLTQFKNYSKQTIDFSEKINCIVGLNGMGKTNLLDAIYYLCMTKSNFAWNDRYVAQHETGFFRLEGLFLKKNKQEKVVAKVIPSKQKVFEIKGVAHPKLADHIGLFPVVMIAPADAALALEGSEERRRFLDNTLSQSNRLYLKQLMIYNKVLRLRNAALKDFAANRTFNPTLIESYNRQMLMPAQFIYDTRQAFLEKIHPIFCKYYGAIASQKEQITCTYQSQLTKADFGALLQSSLEKDRILARTTTGIHKDELVFKINEFPLKRFASQGQLKSFILALKLAQYDFLNYEKDNTPPLLLLDDLFDKLDTVRVEQLMQLLLTGNFGQIFITDTHNKRVEDIIKILAKNYQKLIIQNGQVVVNDN